MKFSLIFYLFLLFPIFHLFIYQIKNLDINNHLQCLKIFKSNNSFGMLIFLNIIIGKLIYFMENKIILKRLYNDYTKKFLPKILLSVFFSLIVAGSTAAIAWLLDPAIKKIFIDKDEKLILIIPVAIILAFSLKGGSLYFAKTILIRTAQEITKIIQMQVMRSLITADTEVIDKKHTGKFISHLTFDVSLISRLVSNVILNLTKDSFTL